MNIFHRSLLALLLLTAAVTAYPETASRTITLLSSSSNSSIHAIATSLQLKLKSQNISVQLLDTDDYDNDSPLTTDLIVAIGNSSIDLAREHHADVPTLSIGSSSRALDKDGHANLQLEQPLCRHLSLIDKISDDFTSVSIIKTGNIDRKSVDRCAATMELDVRLFDRQAGESTNSLVDRALSSDVLLAIPDISIYNRRTIKNVLLVSYRKRIPVFGFSSSFVKAGALAALHSTPNTIATQAALLVDDHLDNGRFSKRRYLPDDFSITVNRQVSKSLGIELPSEEQIRDHVNQVRRYE